MKPVGAMAPLSQGLGDVTRAYSAFFFLDSPLAGGPLRYVVTALPLNPRSPSSG